MIRWVALLIFRNERTRSESSAIGVRSGATFTPSLEIIYPSGGQREVREPVRLLCQSLRLRLV